jgi:hypothetical protein
MPKIQKEPNMVPSGSNSPRSGSTNEIPDMIQESEQLTREIQAKKDIHPSVKNALNNADSQVQHVRDTSDEWTIASPFRLEEFQSQSSDYRGEGLLPEDQTVGVRVQDASRIKERNHPAGKLR